MTAAPEIRYARSREGLHLAYAVLGAGSTDVIRLIGAMTHLRLTLEDPIIGGFEQRVAKFARLVSMDERGAGMSDPVALADLPTLEQRVDDALAVLDDAGIDRVTAMGVGSGAAVAIMLAVTHPTRVDSLVLVSPWARVAVAPDYPIGFEPAVLAQFAAAVGDGWGTGSFLDIMGPSAARTPLRQRFAEFETSSASPGQAQALVQRGFDHDVRHLLPLVVVPTLVLHRTGDLVVPVAMGRYVADRIPGARLVELPGRDNFPFLGDVAALTDEIEEFLTGERGRPSTDRVLATVLFSDIVDSTRLAATLGDQLWRELLDTHDAMVRRQLDRFGGREVKTTGDGFLATFDGPARAIACGLAIRDGAPRLGFEVTVGLHTGEIEIRKDGDVAGIGVHIAARVLEVAEPGQVLVSSAVPPLVSGSGITFTDLGPRDLKGVPGEWHLLVVDA